MATAHCAGLAEVPCVPSLSSLSLCVVVVCVVVVVCGVCVWGGGATLHACRLAITILTLFRGPDGPAAAVNTKP